MLSQEHNYMFWKNKLRDSVSFTYVVNMLVKVYMQICHKQLVINSLTLHVPGHNDVVMLQSSAIKTSL